jgi:hypothetical protein
MISIRMPHRLRDRIKIIRQGIANSKSELANLHALVYSYQIISLFQGKYLKRLIKPHLLDPYNQTVSTLNQSWFRQVIKSFSERS